MKSDESASAGREPQSAMSTPPLAPGGMAPGPFGGPQAQQAAREVNTATLCRIGQETVQDIVYRTMEIFQLLRNMQVGAWGGRTGERRASPGNLRVAVSSLHVFSTCPPLALGDLKCRRPLPALPVSPALEAALIPIAPSMSVPNSHSLCLSHALENPQAWTHPLTPSVPSMSLPPGLGDARCGHPHFPQNYSPAGISSPPQETPITPRSVTSMCLCPPSPSPGGIRCDDHLYPQLHSIPSMCPSPKI